MSVHNYHRFYALINRLPGGDREDLKETLVSSFTDGRTTHLHEMTDKEYEALCASLEERTSWRDQLRKKRSLCLRLMQKAGINTTDWARVNDFCQNPRIAGKVFGLLGLEELDSLQVRLRAIIRKGGVSSEKLGDAVTAPRREQRVIVMAAPRVDTSINNLNN